MNVTFSIFRVNSMFFTCARCLLRRQLHRQKQTHCKPERRAVLLLAPAYQSLGRKSEMHASNRVHLASTLMLPAQPNPCSSWARFTLYISAENLVFFLSRTSFSIVQPCPLILRLFTGFFLPRWNVSLPPFFVCLDAALTVPCFTLFPSDLFKLQRLWGQSLFLHVWTLQSV